MQSDEHPQSKLDDDIIQGRADFLKAVQAKQQVDSKPEPRAEHSAPNEDVLEAKNPDKTDSEKNLEDILKETASQLDDKIQQIDALEEKNKQLKDTLDQSTLSAETKQKQIDELERQLAEKISELANLKNQVEEYAETVASQARQIRSTEHDKDTAAQQFQEQIAEWTETIESLKASRQTAEQTLLQRQQQVDALRQELSQAQDRLEQADADNARLSCENTELMETLDAAQSRLDQVDSQPATESTDTYDKRPLEPYCEPTDEVISEDDVLLEQKLNAGEIPTFNLAEQIMAEQRKASAARRGRPRSRQASSKSGSVEHVMRQYITDAESPEPPAEDPSVTKSRQAEHTERLLRWQDECLSDYQQTLLGSIVQKDMQRFCGQHISFTSLPYPMDN